MRWLNAIPEVLFDGCRVQAAYTAMHLSARTGEQQCCQHLWMTGTQLQLNSAYPYRRLLIPCALFRRYAHGDAKSSNVMLRYNDDSEAAAPIEICLIDMDWSGEAGTDKYLFNPNPMLGRNAFRPKAVKCGVVIEQQHDVDTWHASWFPLY